MTEQQLRDGLRAAVADEPSLGFDPDGVPGRWRARRRRRRAVVAAVVATVAVFGGGALVGRAVLPSSTIAPADGTGPDWSVTRDEPPPESAEASTIRGRLAATFPVLRPDAQSVEISASRSVQPPDQPVQSVDVVVTIVDDQGPAVIEVVVTRDGSAVAPASDCGQDCRRAPMPDGTAVLITDGRVTTFEHPEGTPTRYARHHRLDGSAVWLLQYGRAPADGGSGPSFPLQDDQLIAMAADPMLSLAAPLDPVDVPTTPVPVEPDTNVPFELRTDPPFERLRQHVAAVFPTVVPGASEVIVEPVQFSPGIATVVVLFRDEHGPAWADITVVDPTNPDDPLPPCSDDPPCERRAAPDGGEVRIETQTRPGPEGDEIAYQSAGHYRADGRYASAATADYVDPSRDGSAIERRPIALTDDQLVALATDPELVLPPA